MPSVISLPPFRRVFAPEKLVALRKRAKLKRSAFAVVADRTSEMIRQYEQGKVVPPIPVLDELILACDPSGGTTISDLMKRESRGR